MNCGSALSAPSDEDDDPDDGLDDDPEDDPDDGLDDDDDADVEALLPPPPQPATRNTTTSRAQRAVFTVISTVEIHSQGVRGGRTQTRTVDLCRVKAAL